MSNIQIESDLKEILNKLDGKLDKLTEDVTELKVGQAEIKGDIKALDTKVEGLDKRVSNQEFTNRGVLIGLVVVILGGAAKFFGLAGNP
jgi:predicted nuclease with TOPRIM domain